MLVENPTIGSDVEFFVSDGTGIVSAEGYIPGTKEEPCRFDPHERWFATQLDNILAEGNIPPTAEKEMFAAHLHRLRHHIDTLLPNGWVTVALGAAEIDGKFLDTVNARRFGCDPSMNAWTGKNDPLPEGAGKSNIRSAGFHIHIGYGEPSIETNELLVRAMDLFVGVPSVLIEGPSAKLRREFGYGKAGNYRNTAWGVEYRTLPSSLADTRTRND